MRTPSGALLREILVERYDDLVRRLSRRFDSPDLARDALHDTYVRLERAEIADVRQPVAYLLRMAINIGANTRRKGRLLLNSAEIETLLDLADDARDPAQVAEDLSDIRAVQRAIETLPERRRAIFLAAWVEDVTHMGIAARHGIALRTVQHELKLATDHLRDAVASKNVVLLRNPRREVS